MLRTRPRNSAGTFSCTRVFTRGQNNPVLAAPTKKKNTQEAGYQVDQANNVRKPQRKISVPTRSQDLRRKSSQNDRGFDRSNFS